MTISSLRRVLTIATLIAAAAAQAVPALADRTPRASLVHCAEATCLQLSGHRAAADTAVRIAGRDLAVEGGRNWRLTLPLAQARGLPAASTGMLSLTLVDPRTSRQIVQQLVLPPGALGRRVELAALVVSAR